VRWLVRTLGNTPFLVHYPFQPHCVRLYCFNFHLTMQIGTSLVRKVYHACMGACIYHI
jgi:hypothetical protein